MGYNVHIQLSMDGIDMLKDEKLQKKFCDDLYAAAMNNRNPAGIDIGLGGFCNFGKVLSSGHADVFRIFCAHRNSFGEMYPDDKHNQNINSDGIFNHAYKYMIKLLPKKIKEYVNYLKEKDKEFNK